MGKPVYRLSILPDNHARHVLQLYAGFYELAREVPTEFHYYERIESRMRQLQKVTLWAQLEDLGTGRTLNLCFDMYDGGEIASTDGLEKCDVYLKRSYSGEALAPLEPRLQAKIKPLGLNYYVVGDADRHVLKRLRLERRLRESLQDPLTRQERTAQTNVFLSGLPRRVLPRAIRQRLINTTRDYEAEPQEQLSGRVLYQSRLWPPAGAKSASDLDTLNRGRARLVQQLRDRFGSQFLGGIVPSSYARKHCPESITALPSDRLSYLDLIKHAQIGIVTEGLHHSIPWKVAEYLAASRCIVSEPLAFELPVPLEPGVHYLPFSSNEECLEACSTLLSNPDLARAMQWANFEYYQAHVRPGRIIGNCFKACLGNGRV